MVALFASSLVGCGGSPTAPANGTISGSVLVESEPVPGVTVRIQGGSSTTTSSSGSFSLSGISAGSYVIEISGYPADAAFPTTTRTVTVTESGPPTSANFTGTWIRTSSISGSVATTVAGAAPQASTGPAAIGPLEGLVVTLSGPDDRSTVTDQDGAWFFNAIRAGTYTITVEFSAEVYNLDNNGVRMVTVSVGQHADLTFGGTDVATLAHRWSFEESGGAGTVLVDAVGGADGMLVAGGSNKGWVGMGRVYLEGGDRGDSDYVELPAGVLSSLTDATIELWASPHGVRDWGRIFDFGPNEGDYLWMSWTEGGNAGSDGVEWKDAFRETGTMAPYQIDREYHIVMTFDQGAGTGGATVVKWYLDGELKGSAETSRTLSGLADDHNWLGRSQFNSNQTANASWNEFRIWNGALTPEQVRQSFNLGPNLGVAPDGPGGTVAVAANLGGNYDIWVLSLDDATARRLVHTEDDEFHPRWSPAGTRIAFERNGDVWVVDEADPSIQLLVATDATQHQWSPDGLWLVYQHIETMGRSVSVVRRDGLNSTVLATPATGPYFPSWSPDQLSIIYSTNDHIWRVGSNGGTPPTNLTAGIPDSDESYFAQWSPDGTRILFEFLTPGALSNEIYVMNPDGSNPTNLSQTEGYDEGAYWSPDGSRIVWRKEDGSVWVMNADGSNQKFVTGAPTYQETRGWTPDGEWIILVRQTGGVNTNWVVRPDGSGLQQLVPNCPCTGFAWLGGRQPFF